MSPNKSLYRRAIDDQAVAMCAAASSSSTYAPSGMQQPSSILVVMPFNPLPFSSLAALATSTGQSTTGASTSAPTQTPVVSPPTTTDIDVDVDCVSSISSNTSESAPSTGADSSSTSTPHMTKKERRLIMNRNSARLRRKRHAEKMDKMQGTVRDLEISNKRMRTENDELRKAIADLKALVEERNQAMPASSVATIAPDGAASPQSVASAKVDATTYESLAALALAKYARISAAPEKQGEEIFPKTTLVKPTMPSKYMTVDANNTLFRSYLLCRAASLGLFTRNSSAEDATSFDVSTNVPSSSIRPSTSRSTGVDMTSTTDEIEATKLAAQQLTALAFMG